MYKLPFRTPYTPKVNQEFGNTSLNAWYFAHGITAPFHNGCDFTFGTPIQTYGTECVCPQGNWEVVKITWDGPNSTKGNGVTLQSDNLSGTMYQIVFWHTSEIKVKLNDKLKEGDVVCYVGNTGLVNPPPTADAPHNGSHCHLMLFEYLWITKSNGSQFVLQNSNNGVGGAIDPRNLFNYYDWYETTTDTGLAHDMWALAPFAKLQSDIVAWFKKIGWI